MNKKKSIALAVILTVALVILSVLTFARFRIPWYKNGTRIYVSFLGAITLDQDLEEGVTYELSLVDDISAEEEDIDVYEVIDTLEYRLLALGYDSAVVRAYRASETDAYSFRIEMANKTSAASDIAVVARYGELEFNDGDGNPVMGQDAVKSAKYRGRQTGSDGGTTYVTEIAFTKAGEQTLRAAIEAADSFSLAIVLGDTTLMEASELSADNLGSSLYITSSTEESAKQLALQINSGGLKYEYEVSDGVTISTSLATEKNMMFWAIAVAVLAAFAALIAVYRGYGLIAALTTYTFLLFEILMMILVPGITLNFAGIIGIVCATVLTICSMLVIIRRTKSEYAEGKTIKAAVKAAYKRSIFTILDTDVIIAAFSLLLFFIVPGYAQCFAITLGIGTVISAIMTMFFSQLLVHISLPLFKDKSESFLTLRRSEEK